MSRGGRGDLLGHPSDLGQAGQGRPGQDLSDVMQRHDEFLDSVERCVVAGRDEDRPVVPRGDARTGQLDLIRLGQEQGRDRGIEGQGGQLGRHG